MQSNNLSFLLKSTPQVRDFLNFLEHCRVPLRLTWQRRPERDMSPDDYPTVLVSLAPPVLPGTLIDNAGLTWARLAWLFDVQGALVYALTSHARPRDVDSYWLGAVHVLHLLRHEVRKDRIAVLFDAYVARVTHTDPMPPLEPETEPETESEHSAA